MMFELTEIKGKGFGYVAKTDIPAKTLILTEKPIQGDEKELAALLRTPENKAWYDRLVFHQEKLPSEDTVDREAIAKVRSNCFTDTQKHMFMFEKIGYLNHSCWPNCANLCSKNLEGNLYSIQDIKQGEELCIAYDPKVIILPAPNRKYLLSTNWRFDCICDRCCNETVVEEPEELTKVLQCMEEFDKLLKVDAEQLMLTPIRIDKLFKVTCRQLHSFSHVAQFHWSLQALRIKILQCVPKDALDLRDLLEILDGMVRHNAHALPTWHNEKLLSLMTLRSELRMAGQTRKQILRYITALEPNYIELVKFYEKYMQM